MSNLGVVVEYGQYCTRRYALSDFLRWEHSYPPLLYSSSPSFPLSFRPPPVVSRSLSLSLTFLSLAEGGSRSLNSSFSLALRNCPLLLPLKLLLRLFLCVLSPPLLFPTLPPPPSWLFRFDQFSSQFRPRPSPPLPENVIRRCPPLATLHSPQSVCFTLLVPFSPFPSFPLPLSLLVRFAPLAPRSLCPSRSSFRSLCL